MKIYFEDSVLFHTSFIPENVDYIVDARMGVAKNIAVLNFIKDRHPNAVVYTNSIFAFSNVYAWNEELKVPEIYIRDRETREFTRIDRLTDRELRKAHHLANMYIAGAFDSRVKDMECKDEWRHRTSCEDCLHYGVCIFHIKDDEWKKCIHFNKADVVEVVERLKGYNENLLTANTALSNEILDIKAEAIKEFAEKTDKMITEIYNKHIFGNNDLEDEEKEAIMDFSLDVTSGFDNLVKEMTESER